MVKEIKSATSNTVEFTKRLTHMIVATSLVGLGIYAVTQGKKQSTVYAVTLFFAGAVNVLIGLVTLYRALMQK